VIYKFGESAAQNMLKPFLVDHGLSLKDIAWITGSVGAGAGMTGALVGGAAVARLGRKPALIVFGLAQVVTVLGYGTHFVVAAAFATVAVFAVARLFPRTPFPSPEAS